MFSFIIFYCISPSPSVRLIQTLLYFTAVITNAITPSALNFMFLNGTKEVKVCAEGMFAEGYAT